MTNYEWLVKTGKIVQFIDFLRFKHFSNAEYRSDYKLHFGMISVPCQASRSIAEWLQEEHIVNRYVSLEAVLDILNNPREIEINDFTVTDPMEPDGKDIPLRELRRIISEDYKERIKRINMLDTKEIKDEN